jgi:tetratricopeptide (TPR) repeat protein/predicted MPP superfamily phosphohydrolase
MANQDWLWPTLKNALFEDLAKVQKLSGNWDLVIFSGDLVQSGEEAEFNKLSTILAELWEQFEKLGCAPELIVLPGNHDLKRPEMTSAIRTLRRWWDEPDVQNEFFRTDNNEYRTAIARMLENYSDWSSHPRRGEIKLRMGIQGFLPGDQSFVFEKHGLRVGIVALNSTWLQLNGDDYKGQLHVDTKQLMKVTNNEPDQWCARNDLNLLVTHHPTDWLHDLSLEFWHSEINPPGRFDAHIYGHVHQASARHGAFGGAASRVELQGTSTFGLAKIGGKFDRAHGYSAVHFRADEGRSLQIWPRRSYEAIGGGYNIGSENGFNLEIDQSFTIPLSSRNKAVSTRSDPDSLQDIPHIGSIESSLIELEASIDPAPAHANVRKVEQKLTMDALISQRACWLVAEWGLGEDGFISTIKAKLTPTAPAYRIDLSEFANRNQFSELLKQSLGFNFERLLQLLSESDASLLLLDNIMSVDGSTDDTTPERELEDIVRVILEYCPAIHVLLRSHRLPGPSIFSVIQISALDAADMRNYIVDHPESKSLRTTPTAIDQMHRYTDGIPSRIDQALKELQVVSLSELVSSDVDFAEPNLTAPKAPDGLVIAIRQLSESSDAGSQRAFSLLKVLSLFPQGETFGRIQRFYSTSKFHPAVAAELRSKGLIEVVSHQGQGLGLGGHDDEPEKKLKLGLPARECIWELLKKDEPYELNRRAAEIYFGPSWHSGQFKPPRSYRFDSPHCPPSDIINANTILVRLLREAINSGRKNNVERVLGLSLTYLRALERGDHYASAAALCGDLLPLIPSTDYEDQSALLSAEYGSALRMCNEHTKAKVVLEDILDHQFPNYKRQSILIDLAFCHERLSELPDARALAKQVIEINANSSSGLQAEALLIELAKDDPRRLEKLEALEARSRREGVSVVAGNIALFRARQARKNPEDVRRILAPLMNSKSATDYYNRTRAVVDLAEVSLNNGEKLTDSERSTLVRAYHFVFNEQMPNLFDRSHAALWRDFTSRGDISNLLILFRHSSLRWRLRGQDDKEEEYLEKLKAIVGDVVKRALGKIEREVTYYLVRVTHFEEDAS